LGTVVSLGRPKLKNIAERFPVYALQSESPKRLRQRLRIQRLKLRRVGTTHLSWVVVELALIVGTIVAVRYLSRPPVSPQPATPYAASRFMSSVSDQRSARSEESRAIVFLVEMWMTKAVHASTSSARTGVLP
jgi:hypothetical protein